MRLRVRDLRRYLMLRDISTDACTEKEELVELVLRHTGTELQEEEMDSEEYEEIDALPPALTMPVSAAQPTPQQPALTDPAPQEDTPSTDAHSGTREVHTFIQLLCTHSFSQTHMHNVYCTELCRELYQQKFKMLIVSCSAQ